MPVPAPTRPESPLTPPLMSPDMARHRVVVADDSLFVRTGLEALLASEVDLEIVGSAASLPELDAVVSAQRPDIVITDVRMPPTGTDEGIRIAERLSESAPRTGVIVLSQFADPTYLLRLVATGSARRGYLLKDNVATPGELRRAVDLVAAGGSFIDAAVVETLVRSQTVRKASAMSLLTARETDVLRELATGKSNSAIAAALFVGERAVEKHVKAIFVKLDLNDAPDVNRRVQAVLAYLNR